MVLFCIVLATLSIFFCKKVLSVQFIFIECERKYHILMKHTNFYKNDLLFGLVTKPIYALYISPILFKMQRKEISHTPYAYYPMNVYNIQ